MKTEPEELMDAAEDLNRNTPADIYRNIRNKALEDAAKRCDDFCIKMGEHDNLRCEALAVKEAAGLIRSLKDKE